MTPFDTPVRRVRNLGLDLAALAVATLALPGSAAAAPKPHQIADRLDRIAYQVQRIPEIRGLRGKDREIDRLQARLDRLERITDRQRGRRARVHARRIDRLQHQLARMEYRIEARLDGRRGYRNDGGAWQRNRSHHGHRHFTRRY